MKLNELQDNPGARKERTRIGRGIGSGKGKTAGRGHKGQTSRSGVAINGFEGGQMPIYRRLPKRGFTNPFRVTYAVVNLRDLQKAIDDKKLDGKSIDKDALVKAGMMRASDSKIKLLGDGEITAKIALTVDKASKSALEKVEKAGGSVSIIAVKIDEDAEAKRAKTAAKKAAKAKK